MDVFSPPPSGSEDTAIPVSQDGQRLILANGTLVLRSVKAEDSGYYTCTATNTLGFDTIIVNLLVQGRKPRFILIPQHSRDAAVTEAEIAQIILEHVHSKRQLCTVKSFKQVLLSV